MKRSRAAEFIDDVREIVAEGLRDSPNHPIVQMLAHLVHERYYLEPLQPCTGEAHNNPYIDNCGVCAPRWGWAGEKEDVT